MSKSLFNEHSFCRLVCTQLKQSLHRDKPVTTISNRDDSFQAVRLSWCNYRIFGFYLLNALRSTQSKSIFTLCITLFITCIYILLQLPKFPFEKILYTCSTRANICRKLSYFDTKICQFLNILNISNKYDLVLSILL